MTPATRARKVADAVYPHGYLADWIKAIEAAITEALAAQRERDAGIARTLCDDNGDPQLGDLVASAIRQQDKGEPG
jgi:hypothetical protein